MKQIEEKLAVAEKSVAELRQQLDAAIGQLGRFDPAAGELERAIDQQVRLQARRDVLQKRLELATTAAEELRGDMLVAREAELRAQVDALKLKLATARESAKTELLKLTRAGSLEMHEKAIVNAMIDLHRNVAAVLAEKEQAEALWRHAANAASGVKRRRAIADGQDAVRMQAAIFDGNI